MFLSQGAIFLLLPTTLLLYVENMFKRFQKIDMKLEYGSKTGSPIPQEGKLARKILSISMMNKRPCEFFICYTEYM